MSCHRFKILTRWITFTALLAASAGPTSAASLTVAPTCRVRGHAETELTLRCGDQRSTGVVQYWHTPFGDLETPGFVSELDPVIMHHDGSLLVPNISSLHSGLYYCLLQHKEGTTLWSYELNVSRNSQKEGEHSAYEQHHCGAFRFRRAAGSAEERQAGVSDEQFAGAVAASVLLTFVLGFSAGALSRTRVLRCLGAIERRVRSPRQQQQQGQSDVLDYGSDSDMSLPHMYKNETLEMEEVVLEEDSAVSVTMESTVSSTASTPPVKPQRSFRQKREEEPETTTYLEGCDYMKVEKVEEGEDEQKSLEENSEGCDGEAEEEREFSGSFYLSDKDGGSHSGTDEDECSEDQELKDERRSREQEMDMKKEVELEGASAQEISSPSSSDGDEEDRSDRKGESNNERKGGEEKEEDEEEGFRDAKASNEEKKRQEDAEMDSCSQTDDLCGEEEDTMKNGRVREEGDPPASPPSRGRRSRVIRLYQYDEDGQRYGHLPNPAPDEPGPAPKLKQRSLSLTRLNAIMAAASAGPLDTRETEEERKGTRPHFHMEI